jgi:hypothetical protein
MQRILLIAWFLILCPHAATACLNAVQLEQSRVRMLVAEAERLVEHERYERARRILGTLDEQMAFHHDQGLMRRASRVRALIHLRDGAVRTAIRELQALLAGPYRGDPQLRARLAEAFTLLPRGNGPYIARQILEELDRQDLMPDADAHLLLAQLRGQAGDAAGRDRALARCRQIAREPARCAVDPTALAAR